MTKKTRMNFVSDGGLENLSIQRNGDILNIKNS